MTEARLWLLFAIGAVGCHATANGNVVAKASGPGGGGEATVTIEAKTEVTADADGDEVKYESTSKTLVYKGPDKIRFAYKQATLEGDDTFKILGQVLAFLKKYPQVTMEVEGHTDSRGEPEYNRTLSAKRADAIREWLVSHGIAPGRLTTTGRGEDDAGGIEPVHCLNKVPKEAEACEEPWAMSRKAKFRVTGGSETIVTKKESKNPAAVEGEAITPAPEPRRVWFLAAHLGYAVPRGEISSGTPIGDYLGGLVPIGIGAGYWVGQTFALGAMADLAPGFGGKGFCRTAADQPCKISIFRWRVEGFLEAHTSTGPAPSWWLGLGLGVDGLSVDVTRQQDAGPSSQTRASVYGALRVGVDWFASRRLRVGPFVEGMAGSFFTPSGDFKPDERLQHAGGTHEYLGIGLRGALDFFDR